MSFFLHPHLTRGIVHTPLGAFTINRGIVDLPDELGESLGWARASFDQDSSPSRDTRHEGGAALAVASRRLAI